MDPGQSNPRPMKHTVKSDDALNVYVAAPYGEKVALMDTIFPLFEQNDRLRLVASWITEPVRDVPRAPAKAARQCLDDLSNTDVLVQVLTDPGEPGRAMFWEAGWCWNKWDWEWGQGEYNVTAGHRFFGLMPDGAAGSIFEYMTIAPIRRRETWQAMIDLLTVHQDLLTQVPQRRT